MTAHLYTSPPLEEVGHKLRQQTPETALIWRHGLRPMVAQCPRAEAIFVQQLLAGASLLAALEAATADSDSDSDSDSELAPFDFNHWLPQAAQNGLLLGACLLQPASS